MTEEAADGSSHIKPQHRTNIFSLQIIISGSKSAAG
jgi:hypothetical protein